MGELRGTWRRLGRGRRHDRGRGNRIGPAAGRRSTPVHTHTAEEEIFYVLGGAGLSWQDGRTYRVDCLLHAPRGPAHALIAGDDGLQVLGFGSV